MQQAKDYRAISHLTLTVREIYWSDSTVITNHFYYNLAQL